MNREEQTRKMQKIIAKAWMDDYFKQRLLAEPSVVAREEGINFPPEQHEQSSDLFHVLI